MFKNVIHNSFTVAKAATLKAWRYIMTKFIENTTTQVRVAFEGKTSKEVHAELEANGGKIGLTSTRYLMNGTKTETAGHKVVEVEDNLTGEALDNLLTEVLGPVVEPIIEQPKVEVQPAVEVAPEVEDKPVIIEQTETAVTVSIPVIANPFGGLFGGRDAEIAAKVTGKTDTKADPKAPKVPNDQDTNRVRLLDGFRNMFPDLIAKVEAVDGTVLMRAAQGRILLLKNTRTASGIYFHLNILKNGYTLTPYQNGKSVRAAVKEHSLDDIISAFETKVKELGATAKAA